VDGLQGGLCEERPGPPCAGHIQFQPALTDPLQGMAQPLRLSRNRQNTAQAVRLREKKV